MQPDPRFARWEYLVTDRRLYGDEVMVRVGRGRPLLDFYELGMRVALKLAR